MTSVIWWDIIYSATAAIWSNVCVLHVYKHPLSLLYPGRWVSQCSFFTNIGGGLAQSRRGLGLYIEFRKISSAPPYSPDTATIRFRSYLTKPKQEILVWDACREAEHSCRRRAQWASVCWHPILPERVPSAPLIRFPLAGSMGDKRGQGSATDQGVQS